MAWMLVASYVAALGVRGSVRSSEPPQPNLDVLTTVGITVEQHGGCGEGALAPKIAGLLARSAVRARPPWRVVAEFIASRPSGWTVSIRTERGDNRASTRALQAEDCLAGLEAAAFVVAMSIDPTLVPPTTEEVVAGTTEVPAGTPAAAPPPAEPDRKCAEAIPMAPAPAAVCPQPQPQPRPRPQPQPQSQPSPPVASRSRPRGVATVSGGVDGGVFPGVSALVRIEAGVLGRHWRVALGVGHRVRTRVRDLGLASASAVLNVWMGSLRGCGVPTRRSLEFPLCGIVELGAVGGRGRDFAGAERDVAPWVALVAAPGVLWRVHPLVGLWIEVQGGVTPVRSRWTITGAPGEFRSGVGLGRLGLGLDVRLP